MVEMAANFPVPVQAKQPRNPISRRQIETVASRSVAIFGLVFGAQTLPATLSQIGQVQPLWAWVFLVVLYGGLLASVVASIARRFVRFINGFIALAFLLEVVAWPLVASHPAAVATDRPWLWFLCTVATATAAIAFSTWVAAGYLVLTPVAYGVVRMLPSGGAQSVPSALLDVSYAIILGGAVLLIITLLRQASASVDTAQSTALDRYAHAVRQHATELERVQVDAIVHDSVLTTLLSAARAYTPEAMELATTMAGNAMGHLRDAASASPDDDTVVGLNQLAERIVDATATQSVAFEVRSTVVDDSPIPVQSAEAVYSAAVQAIVNSIQHAGEGAVRRWVTISSAVDGEIRVEVGDQGSGFMVDAVPTERLGLRVSISERVANAGGHVSIQSAPGAGTTIAICWPNVSAAVTL
jgi:signal transduction histidine kinase